MPGRRFALIRRRSVWFPTFFGWVLIFLTGALLGAGVLAGLYPFLSAAKPLPKASTLVIEGWVHDEAVREAVRIAQRDGYAQICTAGTSLTNGSLIAEYGDYASLTAATLQRLGVSPETILVAPGGSDQRHRSFYSAAAVRRALDEHKLLDGDINVLTVGPHARRTGLVYRKVFRGTSCRTGVIQLPPEDYDPKRWWSTSNGAKTVITEAVAWFHERIFDGGREDSTHRALTSPSPHLQPAPAP